MSVLGAGGGAEADARSCEGHLNDRDLRAGRVSKAAAAVLKVGFLGPRVGGKLLGDARPRAPKIARGAGHLLTEFSGWATV